jgi:hypothetical protein
MTTLRIKLANWLLGSKPEQKNNIFGMTIEPSRRRSIAEDSGTVSFTVHTASGGYVVESSYYDEKNDRTERTLHIITSQEDFSTELGKAVFMSLLKSK